MNPEKLIKQYLECLEAGDSNRILALFSKDAMVKSPLYGEVKASEFFPELFEDTLESRISLKDIYHSVSDTRKVAAHFVYDWKMKNGSDVRFECMDVFELDEASGKIKRLSIIYDSRSTRDDFDQLKINPLVSP